MIKKSANDIKEMLPHRSPFLFLDELNIDLDARKATGLWTPRKTWPVFKGHFPGHPMVPGVILIEVMAQAALVLGREMDPATRDNPVFLAGVNDAKFRQPVFPDNTVEVYIKFDKRRRHMWAFDGSVRVEGKRAAQAKLLAAVQEDWK